MYILLALIVGILLLILWPSIKNFKVGASSFEVEKIDYPEKLNELSLDWIDVDSIIKSTFDV